MRQHRLAARFGHSERARRILQFLFGDRIFAIELFHPVLVRFGIVEFRRHPGQFRLYVPVVEHHQGLPLAHEAPFTDQQVIDHALDPAGQRGLVHRRHLPCHLD